MYTKVCKRCGRERIYETKESFLTAELRNDCLMCRDILDDNLPSFIKSGRYFKLCERCNHTTEYGSKSYFIDIQSQPSHCIHCKNLPDESLSYFIKNSEYVRICPNCKRFIKHKTKGTFLYAFRHSTRCHSCTSIESGKETKKHRIKKWELIVGKLIASKMSERRRNTIGRYWRFSTKEEKDKILQKTDLQKKYFWDHYRRASKVRWFKNLKKAFVKYRGDNHWMKDPVVYNKIKESCKRI